MNRKLFHFFFFLCPVLLAAQTGPAPNNPNLEIVQGDTRVEERADGGFHLYIRKKPGLGSVLITESTRDPSLTSANYAYRAPEWNPINGDEIRILDGEPIPKSAQIWSLIDSTPEFHSELGEAFHIFIPYILHYGYETTRHGEIAVKDGTYLNIRAFSLPYADYRGSFRDNPFVLVVAEQQPQPGPPTGNYMKETLAAFTDIAEWGRGSMFYSTGPANTMEQIKTVLEREPGPKDLVICLDTTGSMKNDFAEIKQNLVPLLGQTLGTSGWRIGMVLFKDYNEEYITRVIPFTADLNQVQRSLNGINIRGGGDIPEAVYEGLYDSAVRFTWEAEKRLIILIGDAPPHLRPRGRITKEMVQAAVAERNIRIHALILPQ